MTTALIGHTGFVGSNIAKSLGEFEGFNSKNFQEMAGRSFDLIICSGVQAVKWWANQNPEEDWRQISRLLDVLKDTQAKKFVLISTVDVYQTPIGVDETSNIDEAGLHAYGLHRWRVEQFVRDRFAACWTARLPGLFGSGLKKNLIFDLLNGKSLDGFDARSSFQFYNLNRIGADLAVMRSAAPDTYNFAVEPVTVAEVITRITGRRYDHQTENQPMHYDMRSVRLGPWGVNGNYLMKAEQVLSDIAAFGAGTVRNA